MLKLTYKFGWSLICATICCALALGIIITVFLGIVPQIEELVTPAVWLGLVFGGINTAVIMMAESLGFWSSMKIRPFVSSGVVFGVLLGFYVSGLGLASAVGLGLGLMVPTSLGCWLGIYIAAST